VEFQSIHTEKDELNKKLQEALQKATELEVELQQVEKLFFLFVIKKI
jgi:hypothetical protein